jgi:vacuole morphology and inheritance protein 14
MLDHVDDFFPILIQFLSDPSKEAVELDLRILTTISSSSYLTKQSNNDQKQQDDSNKQYKSPFPNYNIYFTKFMTSLLDLFRRDTNLRYEKGSIIIR